MKSLRPAAAALVALLAGLGLGLAGGVYADQAYPDQVPILGFRQDSRTLDQKALDRALQVVRNDYYGGRSLDYAKLNHGTVRGLVGGLDDRFSYYLDPQEYQRQLSSYTGKYTGVGVEVVYGTDYPTISTVFAGSPADQAGVKAHDVLIAVGGKDQKGLAADQSGTLIRGAAGTRVTLTLQRGDTRFDVSLERKDITIPSVRSARLGGILYLRIYSFGTSTAAEFQAQLKSGLPGASGVILDLRDDGGGFIDAAQQVISEFVASGEAFELRDRSGTVERRPVQGSHDYAGGPLVVLVNASTASASEMVSGSLKVHSRAQLVGVKTFGKGSVQQDFPLPDGSDLHLTIKHWFLPDGSSIDKVGVIPDHEVKLAALADIWDVSHPENARTADTQLLEAITLLGGAG